MNEILTFAIPTLFGLESLAADELRRLDLPQHQSLTRKIPKPLTRFITPTIMQVLSDPA